MTPSGWRDIIVKTQFFTMIVSHPDWLFVMGCEIEFVSSSFLPNLVRCLILILYVCSVCEDIFVSPTLTQSSTLSTDTIGEIELGSMIWLLFGPFALVREWNWNIVTQNTSLNISHITTEISGESHIVTLILFHSRCSCVIGSEIESISPTSIPKQITSTFFDILV